MLKQIHCANPKCDKIVAMGSREWTNEWRLVYCEKTNRSYSSCSEECTVAIRQIHGEQPKQLKLFGGLWYWRKDV